jgi:hypothetical protein
VCPGAALRARAVERVEADVVVVVAGGEQDHVDPGRARVGGHTEAKRVAVERERAVEIGDAQVHVPDAHGRMDDFGVHACSLPPAAPPAIGEIA